jgi:hypothetical protein
VCVPAAPRVLFQGSPRRQRRGNWLQSPDSGAAVVDAVAEVADRLSSIGAQRRDVDDDQVPSSTRRKEALMRLWTVHWVCGSGRPVPDPDVPGVPPPPFRRQAGAPRGPRCEPQTHIGIHDGSATRRMWRPPLAAKVPWQEWVQLATGAGLQRHPSPLLTWLQPGVLRSLVFIPRHEISRSGPGIGRPSGLPPTRSREHLPDGQSGPAALARATLWSTYTGLQNVRSSTGRCRPHRRR